MPNIRDAFFEQIYQQTRQGEDIVIVSADIGAPSLDQFRREFGDRFINVGIAEQNLLAVASGLALSGKKVVAYGLNPFPVTRALDQLRNLMEALQIPVTLAALNAGTCSADAGYTHMPVENLAIMRTFRNVRLITPSDDTIAELAAREAITNPAPRMIQFDKKISGRLYDSCQIDFHRGYAVHGDAADLAIVTNGVFAGSLRPLLKQLDAQGVTCKIIDCFALPMDHQSLIRELTAVKGIVCLDDAKVEAGLGSLVLELLNEAEISIPVKRIGLRFSGGYPTVFLDRELLFSLEKLDERSLCSQIAAFAQRISSAGR